MELHRVYLIAPRGSDQSFDKKCAIIDEIQENLDVEIILPEYDQNSPSFSLARMRVELANANLVIADLSLERPSCYYELGFAEALNRPTRVIAHESTDIHQTSLRNEVSFYASTGDYQRQLTDILTTFFTLS